MKSAEQKAKKVPAIRFTGFDDEWEKLSFADVGNVCMCKRVFKEETSDKGDIPFYKIGTFGGIPDAYITKELYNEYRTKFSYPEKGDILLSAAGTIGRIVEYDGESAYFQDSNIVWLSHDKSITNKFLKVLYPTLKWGGIEGSTIQRLYNDIFLKTSFFKPAISEQQKIGSFFSNIDSLISLEQKKYDKLTQVKKSMLEKMFPKEGATVPEIRFSGFTGKWRKVKIETIASFTRGNGLSWKDIVNNGKYECILYGHLYTDYGMIADSIKYKTNTIPLNAAYSRFGDVLIPGSDTTPTGLARATSIEKDDVLLGGDINVIRPHENINGNFLSLAINVNRNELIKLIKGTTVRHIHNSDIKDIELCVPSVMKEQEMLGNYFKNLDSLISLQQRKLEKLKNIKKSLLEKMFV